MAIVGNEADIACSYRLITLIRTIIPPMNRADAPRMTPAIGEGDASGTKSNLRPSFSQYTC